MKLNKGQTYDILPEEGEAASRTAPSGAKYVSVDTVGGKSIVWNQLFNVSQNNRVDGGQFEINFESQTVTLNGNSGNNAWLSIIPDDGAFAALNVKNHQYIYKIAVLENQTAEDIRFGFLNRGFVANIPANYTGKVNFVCTVSDPDKGKSIGFSGLQPNTDYSVRLVLSACDLTLLFGAGNEPTAEQFGAMFPADSYPYNPGEIISSRTETITAGAETITTGFPELRSTTAARDYINMDDGQTIRNIRKIKFSELKTKEFENGVFYINHSEIGAKRFNASCLTPGFAFIDEELANIKPGECNGRGYYFRFKAPAEIDTVDKFIEKYGDDYIYFELATPTTEPVAVPEPLQEWLPVDAGGTVAFRNSDESKQLAVPNGVSWVRKLNEVE